MPYAILRFQKRKAGSVAACERHNERKKEAYKSNPDIDMERSKYNYPNVKRIEMRVSFLFEEPKLCHRLLEKAKHVFMNVFENVEMIVENGEIKEGEIYGQGSF